MDSQTVKSRSSGWVLVLAWVLLVLPGPVWSQEQDEESAPRLVAPEDRGNDPIEPEDAIGYDSVGIPAGAEVQPGEDEYYDDSDADYGDIESITVTGTAGKVWEDVPESSIGFTAAEIVQERIGDISDLSNVAPNLQINQAFAASNPVLFIRGVGLDDFNANSASAVAIYQDGVYMNSPAGQLFQFFDVANVEVLRGPQAGRYRNASAGAILVQSQAPTPDFNTYTTITYGNYNLVEAEGAVNIPLVEDRLWARASGKFTIRDGYTKNLCADLPRTNFNVANPSCTYPKSVTIPQFPDDFSIGWDNPIYDPVNNAKNWAGRVQLLWDAPVDTGTMEWLLNVHGGQNLSQAAQYQHRSYVPTGLLLNDPFVPGPDAKGYQDTTGDPFIGEYNNGGLERLDLIGANVHGLWSISDAMEIVSITGFEWHERNTVENTDANPFNLLMIQYYDKAWQLSQELRIDSYWSENLESSIGGFFFMENLDVTNRFEDGLNVVPQILLQDYQQQTRSFSFFGEFSWGILEKLTFEGDVRYSHEFKNLSNYSTALTPIGLSEVGFNVGEADGLFNGLSGMASLTYDFNEEMSAYLKYTRGWKPGHFNGGAVYSRTLIEPVRPEKLNSYELGTHLTFFDELLKVQAAVFFYDYEDMQIFALEQDAGSFPLPQLINAKGAEIYGAELGIRLEPIDGLRIRYDVAFLETQYDEFSNKILKQLVNPDDRSDVRVSEVTLNYTGNRLIGSPPWSMSGAVEYTFPIFTPGGRHLGDLTPRFSFSWKDYVFFDPGEGRGQRENLPEGTTEQESYGLVNLSVSWVSPNQIWEVTLWGRNLNNQYYKVQSFDLTEGFNIVLDAYGAPRTFGLTVGAYF